MRLCIRHHGIQVTKGILFHLVKVIIETSNSTTGFFLKASNIANTMAGGSASLINLTWALNETAGGLITIAKRYLQAANEDNVQPLALIAADTFGATLAIAQDSCYKTEKVASMSHNTTTVKFLNAVIGYSGTDSASQLAKSTSGIRFLALVTTLLCFPSSALAAKALSLMMTESAGQDQILPTLGQLENLLKALEPKLTRLAFGVLIESWTDRFRNWFTERGIRLDEQGFSDIDRCPSDVQLQALVNSFRHAKRLGEVNQEEEQPKSIIITASVCLPWITAFVEWCNGAPPRIRMGWEEMAIEGSDPEITIEIPFTIKVNWAAFGLPQPAPQKVQAPVPNLKIETFYSLDRLASLWEEPFKSPPQQIWSGMFSVQNHGRRWIRELESEGGFSKEETFEALSVSLSLITEKLRPKYHTEEHPNLAAPLLPEKRTLADALGLFFDIESPKKLINPGSLKRVFDSPGVRQKVKELRESCHCAKCSGNINSYGRCTISKLELGLSMVAADIISLALFDLVEPIQILYQHERYKFHWQLDRQEPLSEFEAAIHKVLFPQTNLTLGDIGDRYGLDSIIRHCRLLIGHFFDDNVSYSQHYYCVASSYRGQVIFPAMFESLILNGGYLTRLLGGKGQLRYRGNAYDFVMSSINRPSVPPETHAQPVDRPLNLIKSKDTKIRWKVEIGSRHLDVKFESVATNLSGGPMQCLYSAAHSIFVPQCAHDKEARTPEPDSYAIYVTPTYVAQVEGPDDEDLKKIQVIAVAGDDDLRFMALVNGFGGVIRGNACLECCLAICRRTDLPYVIA